MQATLIYNPSAGSATQAPPEALLAALQQAGYDSVYQETQREEELDQVLRNARGLVIAAGGDGTIRAVAKRLIGQPAALSILPMGTMNNVALTLGLNAAPLDLIAGLRNPNKRPLDLGRATGVWGQEYFLEGAGFGFFADLLSNAQPDEKSLWAGATSLVKTLVNFPNYACRLVVEDPADGQETRENFVMVEILNTKSIGPWLRFAPNADPGDGVLDLMRIRAGDEVSFLQYVTNLLAEGLHELPTVEVARVRKVKMEFVGCCFHTDDRVYPNPQAQAGETQATPSPSTVTVDVIPHALELWLPSPAERQLQV